jgi:hypothetical protein
MMSYMSNSIDVNKLLQLAIRGHQASKTKEHDSNDCVECELLMGVEDKLRQAEEVGTEVVLYIP